MMVRSTNNQRGLLGDCRILKMEQAKPCMMVNPTKNQESLLEDYRRRKGAAKTLMMVKSTNNQRGMPKD